MNKGFNTIKDLKKSNVLQSVESSEKTIERENIGKNVTKDNVTQSESSKVLEEKLKNKIREKYDNSPQGKEAELNKAKKFIKSTGSMEINRILACVKFKNSLILHIPPSHTVSLSEKLKLMREGFKKVADILVNDKSIKKVEGSSWLADEHGSLVRKMGFDIKDINFMEKFFVVIGNILKKQNERPYKRVSISREDFLRRYL